MRIITAWCSSRVIELIPACMTTIATGEQVCLFSQEEIQIEILPDDNDEVMVHFLATARWNLLSVAKEYKYKSIQVYISSG